MYIIIGDSYNTCSSWIKYALSVLVTKKIDFYSLGQFIIFAVS